MYRTPIDDEGAPPNSLECCNRLTVFAWGTIVAPVAIGLALGVAVVTGGEVLFGAFNFPPAANDELAILFVLALMTVLLSGIFMRYRPSAKGEETPTRQAL